MKSQRPSAFQIDSKEYHRRRSIAVPTEADITPYNKSRLSKANIWYTCKSVDGKYCLCVLPEDLDKIDFRPRKKCRTYHTDIVVQTNIAR